MNKEILMMVLIGIAVLLLVISIIKKAIKIILTIIVLIIALTMADIFIYGTNPVDEINAYKTNIEYGQDISELTVKIKNSVSNIEHNIEDYSQKNKSSQKLIEENKNLHRYKRQLAAFKHTKRLDIIHNKYSSYLNDIVEFSDSTIKISKTASKGLKIKNQQEKNLKNIMNKLELITKNK